MTFCCTHLHRWNTPAGKTGCLCSDWQGTIICPLRGMTVQTIPLNSWELPTPSMVSAVFVFRIKLWDRVQSYFQSYFIEPLVTDFHGFALVLSTPRHEKPNQEHHVGTSLVAQWIRICLPMQGTHPWSGKISHATEKPSLLAATADTMPPQRLCPTAKSSPCSP